MRATARARVAEIVGDGIVWDNHSCMPLRPGDGRHLPELAGMWEAGFDIVSLNIGFGDHPPDAHLAVLDWFRQWVADRPERYRLVLDAADAETARAEGRLGVCFDIEGAGGIGDDLGLIARYHALGVRWMLIAYNRASRAGGGCADAVDEGLTAFGRDMIREMERVGMLVCLSHTGHRTAREAIAHARGPVIFSHSNCAAVHPHVRNIPDELIRACAETGGVVGINGIGDFLGPAGADLVDACVRHVDHAIQLVGADHVGLALDHVHDREELRAYLRANPALFPEGLDADLPMLAPSDLHPVLEGLRARGHGRDTLARVAGGNWLRIARESWGGGTR